MLFHFSKYSALLLPFVIQGLLIFLILLHRGIRQERLHDRLLAGILLIYTLRVSSWMLGFAGWYDSHDAYSTFMFYFPFNHWYALGPLVYFYFKSVANVEFRLKRKDMWHFVPFFITLGISAFIFLKDVVYDHWIMEQAFSYHYGTKGELAENGTGFLSELLSYLAYISIFAYFIATIRLYRKYKKYILAQFSFTEEIDLSWLRNFLYAVVIGQLIWLIFQIIDLASPEGLSYIQGWYAYFAWGVIIYYLGFKGYGLTGEKIRALHFEEKAAILPQKTIALPVVSAENILSNLRDTQSYLDPALSLKELADSLQMPPVQLSQTINSQLGKNFNELVNGFRVEAVKEKLLDTSQAHLSILGIAFECGFNSKATFNRTFKQLTGFTPSQYVKSQKNKPQNHDLRPV
jgi:AraC-like DNA-binding protein